MKTKDKSRLLFNENPIPILPGLAAAVGLNEAVMLQQIHYWVEINKDKGSKKHFKDGYYWTYNSYKQWQEQLPFWSSKTIMRAIKNLECTGIVVSANYNKWSNDHTKWYRIDYDALIDWLGQNDQADRSNCPSSLDKMSRALPKTTTETITEIDIKDLNGAKPTKVGLAHCVRLFFDMYHEYWGKEHPYLKKTKLQEVTDKLAYYESELCLDEASWLTLIDKYFNTELNCDYNICHFATEGIIMNRFYEELH